MNRKKVDSVLKGIAAAGLTVGGVSTITGPDVVMAATVEEEIKQQNQSENDTASDSVSDTPSESGSDSQFESLENDNLGSETNLAAAYIDDKNVAPVAVEDASVEQVDQSTSISIRESELLSESVSASVSASDEGSTLSSLSESASKSVSSISASESQMASQAASESESMSISLSGSVSEGDSASLSNSASTSELNVEYNKVHSEFVENGYENEYLENLIRDIEAAKQKTQAELDWYKAKGIDLHVYHDGHNYYTIANDLAELLIKYSFYQEGIVDGINYSKWDNGGYTNNSVKVSYTANGQEQYAYFDYVTVDQNGVALTNPDGSALKNNGSHNPNNVSGIMIVKKTVAYTDNGKILNIDIQEGKTVYKVDGQEIPAENVRLNEDGTYTVSYKKSTETATGSTEAAISYDRNASWGNQYFDEKGIIKNAESIKNTNGSDWNNDFTEAYYTGDGTLGVIDMLKDPQGNERYGTARFRTLVDENGNTVSLQLKDFHWNNNTWHWRDVTKGVLVINNVEYYYNTASLSDKGNGQYELSAYRVDGEHWWADTIKLTAQGTRVSNEEINGNFKPSFVASGKETTYVAKNGETKNGNFAAKGDYYFSQDDYEKG